MNKVFKMGDSSMNMFLGYSAAVDYQLMGTVTIAGITIVFCVLLLLVGVFYAFGAIMTSGSKRAARKAQKKSEAKVEKIVKSDVKPMPAPPVVENGISPEVVAAVSAAISYSEGDGSYTIKSIKKQKTVGRPVWAAAGIADNTKPF